MKIGLIGATGFIGRHVARELQARGHSVRAFGRRREELDRLGFPGSVTIRPGAFDWSAHLGGLDAVVIATGALGGADMIEAHQELPRQVAEAAAGAGIRHLVLVSAIGASLDAPTAFLRTKAEGERAVLGQEKPGWTVLRPSLVYGPGGSSMDFLAALAAFPIRPRITSGPIRPILVDDLAAAIADILESEETLPATVDAVGPGPIVLDDYVDALGRWLGVTPRLVFRLPKSFIVRAASFLRLPLVNEDMAAMLASGADGDPETLSRLTRTRPSDLAQGLARHPATPSERRMAALAPWLEGLWLSLGLFWIASGLTALANMESGRVLLAEASIGGWLASAIVLGGGLFDVALGLLTLVRRYRRTAATAEVLTVLLYTALATLIVPSAWADPLGQLMKNIPIVMATFLLIQLPKR